MIKQTYLSTQYFTQSERNIQLNFFIFLCIYNSDEANSKKFNFTI